jgi:hypothetical protein
MQTSRRELAGFALSIPSPTKNFYAKEIKKQLIAK